MNSIILGEVVVSVNKDHRHRISNHLKGDYPEVTLALHIPQSMNEESLKVWLNTYERDLEIFKLKAKNSK